MLVRDVEQPAVHARAAAQSESHRRPAQFATGTASTCRRRDERADRIDSTVQRMLVDNIQLAQSMGAEVVKLEGDDVADDAPAFAIKEE